MNVISNRRRGALACAVLFAPALMAHAALLGIDQESGDLVLISETDASWTVIGHSGLALGGLEWSPSGTLYGFTTGAVPRLYEIDADSGAATPVGVLGNPIFVYEGGLAFSPDGTAYAANMGEEIADALFRIDLLTGAASPIALLDGAHDINGLAWRSDGMLVALDQAMNALISIDPGSGATTLIRDLSYLNRNGEPILGSNGGMTVVGNTGYFATAGIAATIPGSHELYSFDLFTGDATLIGAFPPGLSGRGIGGLAVPEPASIAAILFGGMALLRRRCR